jgi:hypothetical protein
VAGINIGELAHLGLEGSSKLTDEQRREFIEHGNEVVNKLQLSQLSSLMDGLDEELFTDPEKRYYIVVDRLDENWADDTIRYKLVRALIETMRHLNSKVRFAKAIVALRTDLFDRVLRATTDSGFQDEKYRGLCLHITWNRKELTGLLDARISELVRKHYAHMEIVTHADLLPTRVGKERKAGIDYMLDRTLLRPRDLITFFNLCMANSEGEASIRSEKLLQAEGQYSQERLHSIEDEWCVHYPHLTLICRLLEKRRSSFKLGEVSEADLDGLCLQVLEADRTTSGEDAGVLAEYLNKQLSTESLRAALAQILFRAGVVGLKTSSYSGTQWSIGILDKVPSVTVDDTTTVEVHKMFWRALGIRP